MIRKLLCWLGFHNRDSHLVTMAGLSLEVAYCTACQKTLGEVTHAQA